MRSLHPVQQPYRIGKEGSYRFQDYASAKRCPETNQENVSHINGQKPNIVCALHNGRIVSANSVKKNRNSTTNRSNIVLLVAQGNIYFVTATSSLSLLQAQDY